MKILFINIYQNSVNRGAETFVKEISKRITGDVDIISGNAKVSKRWPLLWRFFIDLNGVQIALFTLRNLLKIAKSRYDVIIPLNGGWQVRMLRLLTWIIGGKLVVSGQSGDGWDDRNNLWAFPDVFVALTKKSEKWAKKVNPYINVISIGNGVDIEMFKPKGDVYASGLERPVILASGAFTKQKRLDLTIEAVAMLRDASLLIAGADGPNSKFLRELGTSKLGDRFKMISVSYTTMPSVYRSADLFTLVSGSSESFGNVYVEAMASNLPIVATDDPQRHEVVGEAGLFVNPEDVDAYSNMLRTALKRKWANIPINASKKYSWDEVAKKYEGLFSDLI